MAPLVPASAPILSYSFEDDSILTRAAVDSLDAFYTGAAITRRHVEPRDVAAQRIGHFGFFAERSRETLWRESLEWLRARLAP